MRGVRGPHEAVVAEVHRLQQVPSRRETSKRKIKDTYGRKSFTKTTVKRFHTSDRQSTSTLGDLDLPGQTDSWRSGSSSCCRVGANLHDLGRVSWVGSVLYRSCTISYNGRLGSIYTSVEDLLQIVICLRCEEFLAVLVESRS